MRSLRLLQPERTKTLWRPSEEPDSPLPATFLSQRPNLTLSKKLFPRSKRGRHIFQHRRTEFKFLIPLSRPHAPTDFLILSMAAQVGRLDLASFKCKPLPTLFSEFNSQSSDAAAIAAAAAIGILVFPLVSIPLPIPTSSLGASPHPSLLPVLDHLIAGRQHLFAHQLQGLLLQQTAHFNHAITIFVIGTHREVAAALPALLTPRQTPRRPRVVPTSETLPQTKLSRGSLRGPTPQHAPSSLGPGGIFGHFSGLSAGQLSRIPRTLRTSTILCFLFPLCRTLPLIASVLLRGCLALLSLQILHLPAAGLPPLKTKGRALRLLRKGRSLYSHPLSFRMVPLHPTLTRRNRVVLALLAVKSFAMALRCVPLPLPHFALPLVLHLIRLEKEPKSDLLQKLLVLLKVLILVSPRPPMRALVSLRRELCLVRHKLHSRMGYSRRFFRLMVNTLPLLALAGVLSLGMRRTPLGRMAMKAEMLLWMRILMLKTFVLKPLAFLEQAQCQASDLASAEAPLTSAEAPPGRGCPHCL